MGEVSSNKVLERKTAGGRESHLARAMTLQKALRLTIAKVADDEHDMAMAMLSTTVETVSNDGLNEVVPSDQLLLLLEAPGRHVGLLIIDSDFVGAIVQQQTTGDVQPSLEEQRKPTATDAALVTPMFDILIERVVNVVESPADAQIFKGFQYAEKAEDQRLALMALEASEYQLVTMTVDIARGVRQGTFSFLMPVRENVDDMLLDEHEAQEDSHEPVPDMSQTAMQLEADLDIILCKMRLPLGALEMLEPGRMINLPPRTFPNVTVRSIEGEIVARGVLGQVDGQRAVKLEFKESDVRQPMRRASDRSEVDQPEVSGIDGLGEPQMGSTSPEFDNMGGLQMGNAPAVGDVMPNIAGDLPGIPDLPALPDMSSEPDAGELPDLPPIEPLPELDDLPDLADLPELADLPDLKMA